MAEFTLPGHGEICWRELATSDLQKARDFYEEMFGWTSEQSKVTELKYLEIHIDGKAVGGMMQIDESWGEDPPPSHWTSYVAVDNVDESCQKIRTNGGSIRVEPFDAPNVGRIAMVSDPAGTPFSIIQFAAKLRRH